MFIENSRHENAAMTSPVTTADGHTAVSTVVQVEICHSDIESLPLIAVEATSGIQAALTELVQRHPLTLLDIALLELVCHRQWAQLTGDH